eukprot:GFYU01059967.1.p1 GENE.GFYU01059967.1~~GFYU01059967.1.p1  ORF type:complete len:138 (-),score=32.38 GFYU01059967.1:158-571(-)
MEAFQVYDADGLGHIDTKFLGPVMRGLGLNPTLEEVYTIVHEFDRNHNRTIDFVEFCYIMDRYAGSVPELELRAAFKAAGLTPDKNGCVQKKAIRRMLMHPKAEPLTADEVHIHLNRFDIEAPGKVNLEEIISTLLL